MGRGSLSHYQYDPAPRVSVVVASPQGWKGEGTYTGDPGRGWMRLADGRGVLGPRINHGAIGWPA